MKVQEMADSIDERVSVADGIALRIIRRGPLPRGPSGAPFLLVHGLASNARLWDGVARRLAEAGHTSAAVDLRGHGHSDNPDTGYAFATISENLQALVGSLGPAFARPILVGQSWGANVVLDFAVRYPDLARGIVLVDGGLTDMRDAFPTWEVC